MEDRAAARVALIGQTVADKLFGANDPMGASIRIKGTSFTVIGIMAKRGQGFGGIDRDDVIIVPLTTALRQLQGNAIRRSIRAISVGVDDADNLTAASDRITELLRRLHHIDKTTPDDFTVNNLTAVTDTLSSTTAAISLLLAAIGSISLVVGGIGIMNIMLVSVTERTREIGIRMAIGASRAAIRLQFLVEALMLSLLGCGIGVALGTALATAASGAIGFDTSVTVFAVVVAFAVSAAIGISSAGIRRHGRLSLVHRGASLLSDVVSQRRDAPRRAILATTDQSRSANPASIAAAMLARTISADGRRRPAPGGSGAARGRRPFSPSGSV